MVAVTSSGKATIDLLREFSERSTAVLIVR